MELEEGRLLIEEITDKIKEDEEVFLRLIGDEFDTYHLYEDKLKAYFLGGYDEDLAYQFLKDLWKIGQAAQSGSYAYAMFKNIVNILAEFVIDNGIEV